NSAEPQTHWGPANTNPGKDFDIYPEGLVNVAGIGRTTPPNNPPSVVINTPATGSSFPYGPTLTFSGSASDTEDGDLTSKLTWTSSINGTIGTGGNFTKSLASGIHTITARVTDSGGSTGTASVTITVAAPTSNNPPKVTINSPATGSSFYYGTVISFSGTASDTEDGNLSSRLIWTSSIDGQIGTGGILYRTLSAGTHTITASATDSTGLVGRASVTLYVTR